MPTFTITYKDRQGNTKKESRMGSSRDALLAKLRAEGFIPVAIDADSNETTEPANKGAKSASFSFRKIKTQEIAVTFRTLATMLSGGLPIMETLVDVAAQSENERFGNILMDVAADVREGQSLFEAMANRPQVFTPLMSAMVHAGEESGNISNALSELADYLDTQVELRRKVKTGTRYPLFIFGFFLCALGVIFLYILPKFREIFERFDAPMPTITKIIMGFSSAVADNILYILPSLIGIGIAFYLWKRSERGQKQYDYLIFKVPVLGKMVHQVVIARIARTLGMLIDSGIPVVEAIQLSAGVSGNTVIGEEMKTVRENIVKGSTLSEELGRSHYFPRMLVRMTAAGEATGQLGDMLDRVSNHYTRETATSIDTLMSMLEPILLVLLGVVVGIVIIAVYFPIFNLAQAIQ
jgi:type IV pilus assembly protein PilC